MTAPLVHATDVLTTYDVGQSDAPYGFETTAVLRDGEEILLCRAKDAPLIIEALRIAGGER